MPIASFRDPAGFVLAKDNRIFRVVRPDGARDLLDFLETGTVRRLMAEGGFVASRVADPGDRGEVLRLAGLGGLESVVIEHEAIWFPSYPYEWTSGMLSAAALATLDLALDLLPNGLGLKDATPYNILFRGPSPVFVDALSIERRSPTDPVWRPADQFLRTFAYPLLLEGATGIPPHESLQSRREGIPLAEAYQRMSWAQRLRHPRWVCLPKWLSGKEPVSYESPRRDAEVAAMSLRATFRSLRRLVEKPGRPRARSDWDRYSATCHYDAASRAEKRRFVEAALPRGGRVLDLGANDGEYSQMAAELGNSVVACDIDPDCADRLWRTARIARLDILPLLVNLASPSPAMGWGNSETRSFLARARTARFDCVTMLALLHHLTVTERVPLSHIMKLAASLTRDRLIIEWIAPEDPYYRRLLRGRERLHEDDTQQAFEDGCREGFEIESRLPLLEGRRWLYALRRRRAP